MPDGDIDAAFCYLPTAIHINKGNEMVFNHLSVRREKLL